MEVGLTWEWHSGQAADEGLLEGQEVPLEGLGPLLILAQLCLQALLGAVHISNVLLQHSILLLELHVGFA